MQGVRPSWNGYCSRWTHRRSGRKAQNIADEVTPEKTSPVSRKADSLVLGLCYTVHGTSRPLDVFVGTQIISNGSRSCYFIY